MSDIINKYWVREHTRGGVTVRAHERGTDLSAIGGQITTRSGRLVDITHRRGNGGRETETASPHSYFDLTENGQRIGFVVYKLSRGVISIENMVIDPASNMRREGIMSRVYDKIDEHARDAGMQFGPHETLLNDGYAFWAARAPDHPRIRGDARTYRAAVDADAAATYGEGATATVKPDGRTIVYRRDGKEIATETFDDLAARGVVPRARAYRQRPPERNKSALVWMPPRPASANRLYG